MIISKGWPIAATTAMALGTMLPAAAQTNTNGMPAQSEPAATVTLTENGKPGGRPGEAVFSQRGSDLLVTIKDPSSSTAPRSAMLYKGTCAGGASTAMSSSAGTSSQTGGTSSQTGGTSSQTGGTSSQTGGTSGEASSSSGAAMGGTGTTYKLSPVTHGSSQTTLKGVKLADLTSGNYALSVGDAPRMCGELGQANPIPGTKQ
ncbi:MAG TPA: hypothetical protein VMA36_16695 [Candidatus Limnocylindria bacterium]|jgi:hypothetical protein|nr:hypothetical protein [Candidatus Limnocylindria bacterium]